MTESAVTESAGTNSRERFTAAKDQRPTTPIEGEDVVGGGGVASGPASPAAIDVEYELRREWWLNHGHEYLALYGDDGEMQCLRCLMDFKRAPLEDVQAAVFRARLERAAEVQKEGERDA